MPADGKNKFLVNLEDWRGEAATTSPGPLNIYIYHPEQRSQWGDHFFPTGAVSAEHEPPFRLRPDFASRPDVTPELDRWYCYEYMLQANTPGQRDGRIAFWLDGELIADFPEPALARCRDVKIDRFGLSFHIGTNPTARPEVVRQRRCRELVHRAGGAVTRPFAIHQNNVAAAPRRFRDSR